MTKSGMIFGAVAIIALVGAVAVAVENGGFTTLLSSIATRPSVDRSQTGTGPAAPAQQPAATQSGALEPVPAPAQLPAPTPPASVSRDSTADAKTAPVLDKTAQAGSRVTAADVLVPDAQNGARRSALTAEEKEAVARGLKELGIATANATPSPQSERATTAELNRKALAAAEEARSKQVQAQNQR